MVEEAGKAFGIEKFNGTDFAYWRMQIEGIGSYQVNSV